jgi:hypothetical protein
MPAKMNMFISNGNPSRSQILARSIANVTAIPKQIPTALNAPIISRIHTVKPGCGSCGR